MGTHSCIQDSAGAPAPLAAATTTPRGRTCSRTAPRGNAAPLQLDMALESMALSVALRAYVAWPEDPELVLPTLQHLEPVQLFYVFCALNQYEVKGPDIEQSLLSRTKANQWLCEWHCLWRCVLT
ncbi:hypothetical protein MRX96_018455 [Rhipicephalus microplus]